MPQCVVDAEQLHAALQQLREKTTRARTNAPAYWSIEIDGLTIEWEDQKVFAGDVGDGFVRAKLSGKDMAGVRDRLPLSGHVTVGIARGKMHVASTTFDITVE